MFGHVGHVSVSIYSQPRFANAVECIPASISREEPALRRGQDRAVNVVDSFRHRPTVDTGVVHIPSLIPYTQRKP
jgi:hypothetical protein